MGHDALKLLKPFLFLKIKNGNHAIYQICIPIVLSVVIYFLTGISNGGPSFEFYSQVQQFLFVLAPFNLAALAAIATFQATSLDSPLSGMNKPVLVRVVRGASQEETLTRRRFLTLLFGYITALCFALIVLGLLHALVGNAFAAALKEFWWYSYLKSFYFLLFVYLLMLILVNTFFGLFYLVDRIHRNEDR